MGQFNLNEAPWSMTGGHFLFFSGKGNKRVECLPALIRYVKRLAVNSFHHSVLKPQWVARISHFPHSESISQMRVLATIHFVQFYTSLQHDTGLLTQLHIGAPCCPSSCVHGPRAFFRPSVERMKEKGKAKTVAAMRM